MLLVPVYLLVRSLGAGQAPIETLLSSRAWVTMGNTLLLAGAVVLSSAVIAVPLAWLTTASDLPYRRVWSVLAALPLVIPSYVAAYLYVSLLSPRGIVQGWLEPLGVDRLPPIYGFAGAWLVLTLIAYPYTLLTVRAALQRLDPSLLEAARSLGLSPRRAFWRVTLPNLRPALLDVYKRQPYDMAQFMIGDRRLYEVQHSGGSQARHQTQVEGDRFYHTKGDEIKAEWEELWATEDTIYRGTDTSPGNGLYYTLYENNQARSAWSPRFWDVGDVYERRPFVVFFRKSNCTVTADGFQPSWLRFEAYYPSYTFRSGITLRNVIELTWLLEEDGEAIESYFYAEGYGLVGWGSIDPVSYTHLDVYKRQA